MYLRPNPAEWNCCPLSGIPPGEFLSIVGDKYVCNFPVSDSIPDSPMVARLLSRSNVPRTLSMALMCQGGLSDESMGTNSVWKKGFSDNLCTKKLVLGGSVQIGTNLNESCTFTKTQLSNLELQCSSNLLQAWNCRRGSLTDQGSPRNGRCLEDKPHSSPERRCR